MTLTVIVSTLPTRLPGHSETIIIVSKPKEMVRWELFSLQARINKLILMPWTRKGFKNRRNIGGQNVYGLHKR